MRVIFQFECIHCHTVEESVQSISFDPNAIYGVAETVKEAAGDAVREVIEVFPDARVGGDCLMPCAACTEALKRGLQGG